MIAESLTRPGYFQGYPLVLTPAARLPAASRASTLTVSHGPSGAPIAASRSSTLLAVGALAGAEPGLGGLDPGGGQAVPPPLPRPFGQRRPALDADLVGEALRARADQQQVLRQPLADGPRDRDRVREAGDRGHRARLPGRPVHDRGVELHLAEQVRQPADADRVVVLVGFHHADRGLDRVQGAGPGAEQADARGQADLTALAGDYHRRYGWSSRVMVADRPRAVQ